jgi:tetratricopeptide (TPR) repeat protein
MKTLFCTSPDNARIAYDVTGNGPALILLHGGNRNRRTWHEAGYVDRLKDDFKVITIDIRGHGESDRPTDSAAYAIEKICADVYAVADACDVQRFAVWGFSFGGNIARYLSAWSDRVSKVVIVGISFGPAAPGDFRRRINQFVAKWEPIIKAHAQGQPVPGISDEERAALESGAIPVQVACYGTMPSWPDIEPEELRGPALVVVGSENVADIYTRLADAVSEAARRYEMLGHTRQAVGLLRWTLEFGEQDGSLQGKALLMADLGGIIWKQGHFDEALELLTEARRLAETVGDKSCLATALYQLGELAYVRAFMMQEGELQDALAYHEKCLALRQEIGDRPGITLSLSRVGVLYERMKEYEKAMAYHERAIELAEEIGYPRGTIRPYTHIGGGHRRNGDLRTALTFYRKALSIAQEIDSYENIVFGLANVGWTMYRLDGDFETAWGCFRRALELAEGMDFKFAIGRAYHVLGALYFNEGDMERALEYFEKLARLAVETGYKFFSGPANRHIQEIKQKE